MVHFGGRTSARGGRIVLIGIPKEPIPEFTEATVWVDDANGLIRQFEITEGSGLVRRIRMIDARVNATLEPAAFTFTPPKGVKVIDQTGRSGAR